MKTTDFEIYLTQFDTGPLLQFNLLDKDSSPVNLVDKSVNFYLRRFGSLEPVDQANPNCTIIDALSGICQYDFGPGELAEAGTYFADVQVVSDKIETAPSQLRLVVRPKNG